MRLLVILVIVVVVIVVVVVVVVVGGGGEHCALADAKLSYGRCRRRRYRRAVVLFTLALVHQRKDAAACGRNARETTANAAAALIQKIAIKKRAAAL